MENKGYTYHIKDEYFIKAREKGIDKGLMINKESGNYRPTYYCQKDKSTGLLYMIPLSSKVEEKYQGIYDKQIEKYGQCPAIVIGEYDGQKAAFLLQNMFPITEQYINHIHTRNGNPVPVKENIQETITRNFSRLKLLMKKGKSVVFTDIKKLEQFMLSEI